MTGAKPLQVQDGLSALSVAESEGSINLLLSDVILSGEMGGTEVARILGEQFPGLPVVFMSGYTANAIIHHERVDAAGELLQKPFRKADLARALSRALAS